MSDRRFHPSIRYGYLETGELVSTAAIERWDEVPRLLLQRHGADDQVLKAEAIIAGLHGSGLKENQIINDLGPKVVLQVADSAVRCG